MTAASFQRAVNVGLTGSPARRRTVFGGSEAVNFNLAVILRETADASPGKVVAVYAGGQMTYRELDALSDRLAAGLEAAGLRPGDPVALQLPNIPQFLIAYFGILKAGAVVVPLNVLLKAPEMAFHLGDSAGEDPDHLGGRARRGGQGRRSRRADRGLRSRPRPGRPRRGAVRAAARRRGRPPARRADS